MALDATIGGSSSNSYITRAQATAYFGNRLNVAEWTAAVAAGGADADAALVMACTRLEAETYQGSRVYYTQALRWPRYMVFDRDGILYDYLSIPLPVQEAQAELALAILKSPTLNDATGLEGFVNVKLGSLDVTPRFQMGGALPPLVRRLIAPVLVAGYGTPVVRA